MSKPLQEPTFLVLTALVEEPLHGYAVLAKVEELSDGRVRLRVGTLYAALDRLAAEGLVVVDSGEVVRGRRRRTHRLTGAGAQAVAGEADRMATLARRARARMRTRRTAARPALARGRGARSAGTGCSCSPTRGRLAPTAARRCSRC